jgi:hypothetical protein
MALGPISSAPVPSPQSAPTRDVSAAQRAFFQAALAQVQGVEQPAPAAAAVQPEPKSEPAAETARGYRPGRLLDIKV